MLPLAKGRPALPRATSPFGRGQSALARGVIALAGGASPFARAASPPAKGTTRIRRAMTPHPWAGLPFTRAMAALQRAMTKTPSVKTAHPDSDTAEPGRGCAARGQNDLTPRRPSLTLCRLRVFRRGVAQPGSAPALGAGGPQFKSGRPDTDGAFRGRKPDAQGKTAACSSVG
jgi:hypothetical protein